LFLGAFAKLRKATMSFVMSLCLSVWNNFPLELVFRNLILEQFSKICREYSSLIKVLQKVTGTLHEDLCTFMILSRSVLLRTRNFSDKRCRENQNTHFVLNIFFSESCRLWDNVEECGRAKQSTDDNSIIPRMLFACWITKAADAHWEYVTIIAIPRQKLFCRQALTLLFYVNYVSCCIMWPP